MKKIVLMLICLFLTGCLGGDHEDVRQWMSEASSGLKGKVPPLPEVKPYEPVPYDVTSLLDPFNSARLGMDLPARDKGSGLKPDETRAKEPLEAYPLESLKFVGVITRGGVSYAIITADAALHRVKIGNYMGQNFGKITEITESEVALTELVQDSLGDWSERVSTLFLQEQEGKK